MKRTEILELANQLTERKGEKVLNLGTLYKFVLQDICKRERFWWRRVTFSFSLVVGQPTYDLTKVVTTPASAMTEILLDEITKFTLILQPNPLQIAEMTAIFDPEGVVELINNTQITQPAQGNVNSPGGRYTINPGDGGPNVIRMDPPDQAYTAYIIGWGMPSPATETTTDTVPLIPSWGHNTIVAGIVAKIFKFAYGSKNDKTVDAQEEYAQGLQDLMQRKQFDPNYRSQLISLIDESGAMSGAIRST